MDKRQLEMLKRSLICVALLALGARVSAIEGVKGGQIVKGGYRGQDEVTANIVSFPASENGTCYKRVPYDEAVAANITQGHFQEVPGTRQIGFIMNSHGWVTIIDCCDGYVRSNITRQCEAYCEGGCFGGTCASPNNCTCEHGWAPVEGVCKPVCHRPCGLNAYCFSPNHCECKLFYEEVNGECKPICPGGCVNGDCVEPKVCRCKPGHMLNDSKVCEPVCEGGCQHGTCVAPGVCSCSQGYRNPGGDRESCEPHCPNGCENGICASPGTCTCPPGHTQETPGVCRATCHGGCMNGRCLSSGQCVCDPGFDMDQRTGRCTFRAHGDSQYGPTCERPCLNGDCTGYNQCTCKRGYSLDPTDVTRTKCIPHCAGGCLNGVCSGPNFCLCNSGYTKDRSVKGLQRCVPV